MSEVTKILSKEHQNILRIADALSKECTAIKCGKGVDNSFFEKAIYLLKNYEDKMHHGKEESVVFTELSKWSVKLRGNPVKELTSEHETERNMVKNIEQSVREDDEKKIAEDVMKYVKLSRDHIFKEERVLYPMINTVLIRRAHKAMLDKFEKIDDNISIIEQQKQSKVMKEVINRKYE